MSTGVRRSRWDAERHVLAGSLVALGIEDVRAPARAASTRCAVGVPRKSPHWRQSQHAAAASASVDAARSKALQAARSPRCLSRRQRSAPRRPSAGERDVQPRAYDAAPVGAAIGQVLSFAVGVAISPIPIVGWRARAAPGRPTTGLWPAVPVRLAFAAGKGGVLRPCQPRRSLRHERAERHLTRH
jgi:hypothetical protein